MNVTLTPHEAMIIAGALRDRAQHLRNMAEEPATKAAGLTALLRHEADDVTLLANQLTP